MCRLAIESVAKMSDIGQYDSFREWHLVIASENKYGYQTKAFVWVSLFIFQIFFHYWTYGSLQFTTIILTLSASRKLCRSGCWAHVLDLKEAHVGSWWLKYVSIEIWREYDDRIHNLKKYFIGRNSCMRPCLFSAHE